MRPYKTLVFLAFFSSNRKNVFLLKSTILYDIAKRKSVARGLPRATLFYNQSYLDNDDIFFLQPLFQAFGERVVGDEYANIFDMRKGVRFNFADFRAIEHNVGKFGALANEF